MKAAEIRGLFLAALDRYAAALGRRPVEALSLAATLDEGVRAFLGAVVDLVVGDGDRPHGCLVACAGADAAECDPAVRERLAAVIVGSETAITRWAEDRRTGGPQPAPRDPAGLATVLVTLMHGLAVHARAGASRRDLERTAEAALAFIGIPAAADAQR